MSEKSLYYLKRIFRWEMIAGVCAVLGAFWGYDAYVRSQGGALQVMVDGKVAGNNHTSNIVVFMDNDSINISGLPLTPVITNIKKYSVKNFNLRYTIESHPNSNIQCTDFYSYHKMADKDMYDYYQNILYANCEIEPLLMRYIVYGPTESRITSTVNYEGGEQSLYLQVNLKVMRKLRRYGDSQNVWLDQAIGLLKNEKLPSMFDLYFITSNFRAVYKDINRLSLDSLFFQNSQSETASAAVDKLVPINNVTLQTETACEEKNGTAKPVQTNDEMSLSAKIDIILAGVCSFLGIISIILLISIIIFGKDGALYEYKKMRSYKYNYSFKEYWNQFSYILYLIVVGIAFAWWAIYAVPELFMLF